MELPEALAAFIDPIIRNCSEQFPRKCTNCGKQFDTFGDFISGTRPVGAPQCSPLEEDPLGLLTYVNCACGSTVLLSCTDPAAHEALKRVLDAESLRTGLSKKELLLALRAAVRSRITGK